MTLGNRAHYCDEHFLVRAIEYRIKVGLRRRIMTKEINKMKKKKYDELYKKAFEKIMKEEGLSE